MDTVAEGKSNAKQDNQEVDYPTILKVLNTGDSVLLKNAKQGEVLLGIVTGSLSLAGKRRQVVTKSQPLNGSLVPYKDTMFVLQQITGDSSKEIMPKLGKKGFSYKSLDGTGYIKVHEDIPPSAPKIYTFILKKYLNSGDSQATSEAQKADNESVVKLLKSVSPKLLATAGNKGKKDKPIQTRKVTEAVKTPAVTEATEVSATK